MTVSSISNDTRYAGNGVTLAFASGFTFYDASSITVFEIINATGVKVPKVLTTDFTVTGGAGSTGTITMLVATPTGNTLVIQRSEPYSQLTDLGPNDPLPAEVLESTYDKLVMQIQQVYTLTKSSIQAPVSFNPNTTAPYVMAPPTPGTTPVGNDAGTGWNAASIASIGNLPAVISTPQNFDVLRYSTASGVWLNSTLAAVLASILTTRGDLLTVDAGGVTRKAIGAAGTHLTSDGVDASWTPMVPVTQVFKTAGSFTYTPTPGMKYCVVEAEGAGGAGGSTASASTNVTAGGGGGGSGSYSRSILTAAQIGASKAVVIGAAGVAAAAGNNTGGAGADTTLGATLVVAKGGLGGVGSNGNTVNQGGAGGATGTGDITRVGRPGFSYFSTGGATGALAYNNGGDSTFGAGGKIFNATTGYGNGAAATGNGAGGSGGMSYSGAGAFVGGAGSPGYLVIVEYF